MKVILRIILLSLCLYSCSDLKEDPVVFRHDTEVIAVFTPDGIGDQTKEGLIYKGIVRTTDSLGLVFRPVVPMTYEEGAETLIRLARIFKLSS